MPIDYGALQSGDTSAQVPADGTHTARLERAKIVETNNGERLLTEWSEENGASWDSWNRFDTTGMSFTQDLLRGLGIFSKCKDDDSMTMALESVVGETFEVRTTSKQGSQGDRWFTNTYVDAKAGGVQEDLPIDTGDFEPAPAASGADDDIPF